MGAELGKSSCSVEKKESKINTVYLTFGECDMGNYFPFLENFFQVSEF